MQDTFKTFIKMILKEDFRVKVEEIDGLIIKTFKSSRLDRNDVWQNRVNEFSTLYGHVPQIIEYTPYRLVTTKVDGECVWDLLEKTEFKNTTDWINNYKKVQFLFFELLTHFSEFNLNHKYPLMHDDLTLQNLYIQDDIMVCIDIDSMILSRYPIEFTWLAMPHQMTRIERRINTRYNMENKLIAEDLLNKSLND